MLYISPCYIWYEDFSQRTQGWCGFILNWSIIPPPNPGVDKEIFGSVLVLNLLGLYGANYLAWTVCLLLLKTFSIKYHVRTHYFLPAETNIQLGNIEN